MQETRTPPRVTIVGGFTATVTWRGNRPPEPGEALTGLDSNIAPGGRASNQAVQCARLGGDVEFIGAIGADALGELALKLFAGEGVGTTYLERTAERKTGGEIVWLDSSGNCETLLNPGANALLSPAEVDRAADRLRESLVVMTNVEIPAESAAHALQLTRQGDGVGILNPTPASAVTRELLVGADIVTPNEEELRTLLGRAVDDPTDSLDLCNDLLALGVPRLILTRGARGALIVTPDGYHAMPAQPIRVVDPAGAGDAFHGTLAAGLAMHLPLEPAVRRAVAAGSLACTEAGTVSALPNAYALERFLATGDIAA